MPETFQLPDTIHLIHHGSIGSTNDRAKILASDGAQDGTLVWADEQTRGRGRNGRHWYSPPGNLYCSLILRPKGIPSVVSGISLIASLAVASALENFLPQSAELKLKWPNDVLINGKKTAGILLETSPYGVSLSRWVVVGCGVNIASSPPKGLYPMTSLNKELGVESVVEKVLVAYIRYFLDWLEQCRRHGLLRIRDAWLERAKGLGEPITVNIGKDILEGIFWDMDESGALIVKLSSGDTRKITAGDVL